MKKRKFRNRLFSFFLATLFLILLSVPAAASSAEDESETLVSTSCDEPTIQPRGFVRTYEIYVQTNVFYDFFYDSNWWGETDLTVTFKSTEGPTSITVGVRDNDGYSSGKTLSLGQAASFNINPSSFRIMATKESGPNGNVTLVVTLS